MLLMTISIFIYNTIISDQKLKYYYYVNNNNKICKVKVCDNYVS